LSGGIALSAGGIIVSLTLSQRDDTMHGSDEIYAKITKVLAQALGVDEHEITPSATLQGDLGAESIDFLDIVFRLEREFMIKIPRGEFLSALVFQDESKILCDGQVTDEGLTALRSQMPYADWNPLVSDRRLNRIYDLFTVELLSSYITWKLDGIGESNRTITPPVRITCPNDLPQSVILTRS
jgi:acyl carrier protein